MDHCRSAPTVLHDDLITTFLGYPHAPTPLGDELLEMRDDEIAVKITNVFQNPSNDITALQEVLQQLNVQPSHFATSHANLLTHIRDWKTLTKQYQNKNAVANTFSDVKNNMYFDPPAFPTMCCAHGDEGTAFPTLLPSPEKDTFLKTCSPPRTTSHQFFSNIIAHTRPNLPQQHPFARPLDEHCFITQTQEAPYFSTYHGSLPSNFGIYSCYDGDHHGHENGNRLLPCKECEIVESAHPREEPQPRFTASRDQHQNCVTDTTHRPHENLSVGGWRNFSTGFEAPEARNLNQADILVGKHEHDNKDINCKGQYFCSTKQPDTLSRLQVSSLTNNHEYSTPNSLMNEVYDKNSGARTSWYQNLESEDHVNSCPPPHSTPAFAAKTDLARPSPEYSDALELLNAVAARLSDSANNTICPPSLVPLAPKSDTISGTHYETKLTHPITDIAENHQQTLENVINYKPRAEKNYPSIVSLDTVPNSSGAKASGQTEKVFTGIEVDADTSTQASSRRGSTRTSLCSTAGVSVPSPTRYGDVQCCNTSGMLQDGSAAFEEAENCLLQESLPNNTCEGDYYLKQLYAAAVELRVPGLPAQIPVVTQQVERLAQQLLDHVVYLAWRAVLCNAYIRTAPRCLTSFSTAPTNDVLIPANPPTGADSDYPDNLTFPPELQRLPHLVARIAHWSQMATRYLWEQRVTRYAQLGEVSSDAGLQESINGLISGRDAENGLIVCQAENMCHMLGALDLELLCHAEDEKLTAKERLRRQLHQSLCWIVRQEQRQQLRD